MGRAIFIGEHSDGFTAIGMLVSGRGAEQQGWARGREGGQGGRRLGLPHGRPSAQPITPLHRHCPCYRENWMSERDGWKHLPLWRSQQWGPQLRHLGGVGRMSPIIWTWLHLSQCKRVFQCAVKFSLGLITYVLKFCTYFVQNWKVGALFCTAWPEPAAKAIVLLLITRLCVWSASADRRMPIFSCFGSANSYLSYAHIRSLGS